MKIIDDIKELVDNRIAYRSERQEPRSLASDILGDRKRLLAANGDDYALTYADLLLRSGVDQSRIKLMRSELTGYHPEGEPGGLVCVVDEQIVLDPLFSKPRMKVSLKREGYSFTELHSPEDRKLLDPLRARYSE